jgi:hypothetical protein
MARRLDPRRLARKWFVCDIRWVNHTLLLIAMVALLAGCAGTPTIEQRRTERAAAYASLSADDKALVDAGQIRIGMPEDAVFIAWGQPDEVTDSEDQQGRQRQWIYRGFYFKENRYWTFREAPSLAGQRGVFERYLQTDLDSRSYISAQITFKDGKVTSWRTLPKPADY